jgi:hypothetical protein
MTRIAPLGGGRCAVWWAIVAGTMARVLLGGTIGLGVDESYAVAVARPMSLSYYDHPPLVFWIAGLSTRAFGASHDLLLRLPFIALYVATTWLLYLLTRRLFGEEAGFVAVVLAQLIPVFTVSDGGWILPDGPLLLGFVGTALCLAHVAFDQPASRAWVWWLGAGVSTGIAGLSKYHAVFLIAGTLLFLLTSERHRRWLTRPEPWVAAAIAAIMSLPVFVWNAEHHWASFRFQGGRAGWQLGVRSATALFENLAGQAGYLLPWIWLPLLWLSIRAARRGPNDARSWLLICLGAGPFVVFTLASLGGRAGLPHWPAPGFFLLVPILADALTRRPSLARRYLSGTAAIVLVLLSFAASQIRTGWFSDRFPGLFRHGDPSLEAVDWSDVRTALPHGSFVVAANWIDAAKLGAALVPDVPVLCFSDDARQFRYTIDQRTLIGSDALVVLRGEPAPEANRSLRRIAPYFQRIDSVAPDTIDILREGRGAFRLLVYRATRLLRPYGAPQRGGDDSFVR